MISIENRQRRRDAVEDRVCEESLMMSSRKELWQVLETPCQVTHLLDFRGILIRWHSKQSRLDSIKVMRS